MFALIIGVRLFHRAQLHRARLARGALTYAPQKVQMERNSADTRSREEAIWEYVPVQPCATNYCNCRASLFMLCLCGFTDELLFARFYVLSSALRD